MRHVVIPVVLDAIEDDLPREFIDDIGEYLGECLADYVEKYGVPVDMSINVCRPKLETIQ